MTVLVELVRLFRALVRGGFDPAPELRRIRYSYEYRDDVRDDWGRALDRRWDP